MWWLENEWTGAYCLIWYKCLLVFLDVEQNKLESRLFFFFLLYQGSKLPHTFYSTCRLRPRNLRGNQPTANVFANSTNRLMLEIFHRNNWNRILPCSQLWWRFQTSILLSANCLSVFVCLRGVIYVFALLVFRWVSPVTRVNGLNYINVRYKANQLKRCNEN